MVLHTLNLSTQEVMAGRSLYIQAQPDQHSKSGPAITIRLVMLKKQNPKDRLIHHISRRVALSKWKRARMQVAGWALCRIVTTLQAPF